MSAYAAHCREARQALVDHMLLTAKPWNLGALAGGLATLPVSWLQAARSRRSRVLSR